LTDTVVSVHSHPQTRRDAVESSKERQPPAMADVSLQTVADGLENTGRVSRPKVRMVVSSTGEALRRRSR
jgi:hypothetical protein